MLPRSKRGRAILADAAPSSGPAALSADLRHIAALRRLSSASGVSLPWSETSNMTPKASSSGGGGGGGGGASASAGSAPGRTPLQSDALTPPSASPPLVASPVPFVGRPPPIAEGSADVSHEGLTDSASQGAAAACAAAGAQQQDRPQDHGSRAALVAELLTPGPSHVVMRMARLVGLAAPLPPEAPPPTTAASTKPAASPRTTSKSCHESSCLSDLSPLGAHRLAESCGGFGGFGGFGGAGGGRCGECGGGSQLSAALERCLQCFRRCVGGDGDSGGAAATKAARAANAPPRVIAKGLPQPFKLSSLTAEQKAELEEARRIYEEAGGCLTRVGGPYEDVFLIRFLVLHCWSAQRASKQLRAAAAWRREWEVDALRRGFGNGTKLLEVPGLITVTPACRHTRRVATRALACLGGGMAAVPAHGCEATHVATRPPPLDRQIARLVRPLRSTCTRVRRL